MSANRPKNTKPELILRKALYQAGHRGYRINYRIQLQKPHMQKPAVQKPARRKGGDRNSPPYEGGVAEGRGGSHKDPTLSLASVRPDITFVGRKLAIFVHGCYWHRCPKCNYPLPSNNTDFWRSKFERNTARDTRKRRDLRRLGWKVITVWECDLKNRPTVTLNRILKALA